MLLNLFCSKVLLDNLESGQILTPLVSNFQFSSISWLYFFTKWSFNGGFESFLNYLNYLNPYFTILNAFSSKMLHFKGLISKMLHISKEWFSNNNSALCMRRLSSLKVGENFVGKIYAENVQVWQISLIDASCLEMLC